MRSRQRRAIRLPLGGAMTRDEESRFLAAGAADMGVILDAPQCESLLRLVE